MKTGWRKFVTEMVQLSFLGRKRDLINGRMVKPGAFKVSYSTGKVLSIADSARHAPCRKKASQAWCRKTMSLNFEDPR